MWLGGFAKSVGQCSVFMVELWGMFEGLKLTKFIELCRVEINIGSIDTIHAIEKVILKKSEGLALFKRIQRLFKDHESVREELAFRESNKYVNVLENI